MAFASLDAISDGYPIFCPVIQIDLDDIGLEYLPDLFPNQINDCFVVQLGRQSLLYTVNDGEFGIALLRVLKETLGFLEETHILDRDHSLVGEGPDQPDLPLGQQLGLDVPDRDGPDGGAMAEEWRRKGHLVPEAVCGGIAGWVLGIREARLID